MKVTLSHVAEAIESLAPLGLAESWDRSGLQIGNPTAPVSRILVALDPSAGACAEAHQRGVQLVVTHHPLLLHPLETVDLSRPRDRLVADMIQAGIALYSAHTNLDRAEGGVNDELAACLELEEVEPLSPGEPLSKVVVTVPVGYGTRVREAMFAVGAGRVGRYDRCSFWARGEGTFMPRPGANPFLGESGSLERVDEDRLEILVPNSRVHSAVRALRDAHPYEEPAIDVYALNNDSKHLGSLGRIGTLRDPIPLSAWARRARSQLEAAGVRWVGDGQRLVSRVAVCGGSAESFWPLAMGRGADVLVTGDVKYHTASDALAAGFALLDAGHGPTEKGAVRLLVAHLREWAAAAGAEVEILAYQETDPYHWVVE